MGAWHPAYTQHPICSSPTVPGYGLIVGADVWGHIARVGKIVRYLRDLIANVDFRSQLNNFQFIFFLIRYGKLTVAYVGHQWHR